MSTAFVLQAQKKVCSSRTKGCVSIDKALKTVWSCLPSTAGTGF